MQVATINIIVDELGDLQGFLNFLDSSLRNTVGIKVH